MSLQYPRLFHNPLWPGHMGDPFVLKVRGRYYAYATETMAYPEAGAQVFPILTSTDLINWHEVGKAMPALPPGYFFYWAPEVIEDNGQFLLYYAVHHDNEFTGGIRVAVAERPEGPFRDSGHDLTTRLVPWAIDPHVLRDHDGQWYLYMTIEYTDDPGGLVGSGNAVARLRDHFTVEDELTRVTPPSQPWQLFESQRKEKGGLDWYTVEGPTLLRHRRRYYEMYSGGCYYRDNYAVSYATANHPMGTGRMHDTSWQDWAGDHGYGRGILIRGNHELIGPGHNSVVVGPDNATQYIVYHAWQQDMTARRMCINRLFWHGDDLWTAAPSSAPQPAPALPLLRELFEVPELDPSWHAEGGQWQVSHGAVVQMDQDATHAILWQQTSLSSCWLLEVNLQHIAGNGTYGILLRDTQQHTLRLLLSSDGQMTLWSSRSPDVALYTTRMTGTVLMQAWHQLMLSQAGSLFSVQFDGQEVLAVPVQETPDTFALYTDLSHAAFSGISLTDHFRDEFLDDSSTPAQLGWTALNTATSTEESTWQIRHGALEQTQPVPGVQTLLKGSTPGQFESGATLRLLHTEDDQQGSVGLAIHYSPQAALYVRLAQHAERHVLVLESTGFAPVINRVLSLPGTFNITDWHTLRLVQEHDLLSIYLDGEAIIDVLESTRPARTGLTTRNASAAFTGVWHTNQA